MELQEGIYENLSNKDYHTSKAVSRSMLVDLEKSTLHYWQAYESDKPIKKERTEQMDIGSAVHCLVLEPDEFYSRFFVKQKVDGRTKEGKKYNAKIDELATGKIIIDSKNEEIIYNNVNKILENSETEKILFEAKKEISLFWRDEETGIVCKARPDIWNDRINVLCDIKTASNSLEHSLVYSGISMGYDIQAAMQIDAIYALTGIELKSFYFIVSQTTPPYEPFLYRMPIEIIESARVAYKRGLKLLKLCQEKKMWGKERKRVITLDARPFIKAREKSFVNLLEIYND